MKNNSRRIVLILLVLIFSFTGCGTKQDSESPEKNAEQLNIRQLQSVCELATLECYYHNTAKLNSQSKVLFWNTSKKLWIEYSGIVKIGIDISKLDMKLKDQVVTIALPNAEIFSCKVDETSLSKDTIYTEHKGLGGSKINAEDQSKAFEEAQKNMLETVQNDQTLLLQAKERAQTLLANYVKSIGDAIGVEYEVRWETPSAADH